MAKQMMNLQEQKQWETILYINSTGVSVCLSVCPGTARKIFQALPGQTDFQLESVTSGQTQTQKKRERERGGDKNRVRCGYNGVRRVPLRM